MKPFRKPNATGRSSGKRIGRVAKAHRPPPDEPFIWHTRELLTSAAWRAQSVNCMRLLSALEVEHMNHAGTENGTLKATYDQLEVYGLTRSEIRPATEEAEFLGLLRCDRGGRWVGTNKPSAYRLTYLADRDGNAPTNEWGHVSQAQIKAWRSERADQRRGRREHQKKQIPSATSRTTVVRLPALPKGPKRNYPAKKPQKSAILKKPP